MLGFIHTCIRKANHSVALKHWLHKITLQAESIRYALFVRRSLQSRAPRLTRSEARITREIRSESQQQTLAAQTLLCWQERPSVLRSIYTAPVPSTKRHALYNECSLLKSENGVIWPHYSMSLYPRKIILHFSFLDKHRYGRAGEREGIQYQIKMSFLVQHRSKI